MCVFFFDLQIIIFFLESKKDLELFLTEHNFSLVFIANSELFSWQIELLVVAPRNCSKHLFSKKPDCENCQINVFCNIKVKLLQGDNAKKRFLLLFLALRLLVVKIFRRWKMSENKQTEHLKIAKKFLLFFWKKWNGVNVNAIFLVIDSS